MRISTIFARCSRNNPTSASFTRRGLTGARQTG